MAWVSSCVQRQLESITTDLVSDVQPPLLVHSCTESDGWASVLSVPGACASAPMIIAAMVVL